MNQKPELLQSQFRNYYLRHEHLVTHLNNQTNQLCEIDVAFDREDPSELGSKVAALDLTLLRYACVHLSEGINEAAKHDCARLIVESLFDVTGKTAADSWESWLSFAAFWPQLAKEKWRYSVGGGARDRASESRRDRVLKGGGRSD